MGSSKRRECRSHADCGDGRQCCGLYMGETMCLPSCTTQLGDRITCKTIKDCPRLGRVRATACDGDGVKFCEY